MDPAVKIILDEMQQQFSDELRKGFSEHDEKVGPPIPRHRAILGRPA